MILTFWDGVYISKWRRIPRRELIELGGNLILTGLKEGVSLDKQIVFYKYFLDTLKDRKIKKKRIYRSDHQYGLSCMMALIKLKVIEEEDDPNNGLYRHPKQIRT
tara:strand:- start:55 stop:369 length:315 start_codon:yes stop_codon:yes gene_type:complete